MTRSVNTPPLQFRDIDEVADALRDAGGRFSATRRLVLEALFAADAPISADRIAAATGEGGARLDATTVYRILERLEELGVVRHVHLGHGPGLYGLTRDGGREYLVCDGCDSVTALDPAQLDPVRALVREQFGFEASFTHFPLVGRCAACAGDHAPGPAASAGHGHAH
jgi:Fur family ferric uptake transcriptional regulator